MANGEKAPLRIQVVGWVPNGVERHDVERAYAALAASIDRTQRVPTTVAMAIAIADALSVELERSGNVEGDLESQLNLIREVIRRSALAITQARRLAGAEPAGNG